MLNKYSQKNNILEYLRNHREGAYVYELIAPRPHGLGVAQYNARIYELRRDGHDIRNDFPGHFYLHTEPVQTKLV